ncbi:xin actin-binding repeat-containing protein 2 isoform X10 [Colletes gigas]|uniref:xin actin-binding repeat-containing protein 2 isoform X10 n=1 Tax=Colletes gigas TaxID=935657 RepID=UPI001C9BB1B5|nr:xin actin-binding repeat-containing protein 2 isoform X10 [Colletes gigas]
MAEVATKKSINVVSSKKSEVCGVQSNNGLLDLDNITASNNQLITLCDTNDDEDDLILTNNTRNELDSDDKSLQELIESELALRICSSNEEDASVDADDRQETSNEPETVKRIVLDRRQDTVDANTEFIVAETEHCSLIEEPYSYQNGHVSPDTKISGSVYEENAKPEPIAVGFRDEEEQVFDEQPEVSDAIVVQKTTTDEIDPSTRDTADDGGSFPRNEDDQDPCPTYPVLRTTEAAEKPPEAVDMTNESFEPGRESLAEQITATPVDKYQDEEEVQSKLVEFAETDIVQADSVPVDDEEPPRLIDDLDVWMTAKQSDRCFYNLDETLCQPNLEKPSDPFETVMAESGKEQDVDGNEFPAEEECKVSLDDKSSSSIDEKIPEDLEECPMPGKPVEEEEEETRGSPIVQSRSFDDGTLSQSEASTDAASTQEFIDMERRVLSEECAEDQQSSDAVEPRTRNSLGDDEDVDAKEEEMKEETNENADEQNAIAESSSELSVSEATFIEKTEVVISESSVTIFSETKCLEAGNDSEPALEDHQENLESPPRAPLATPDDEASDSSNSCDSESREETITTTASVVTSSSAKGGSKTKKKKIEGVAGNDASPNLTPRTKKTKKSKKSELEKENISVNSNLREPSMHTGSRQMHPETHDFSNEDDLSNVNVKSLKSSFNKFDALSKKTVLHVRSIDAGKVQQQLNAQVAQNGDTNPNCRSCGKVVFQMEQTKAEGLVWHKNCFRCVQCSKQLNVDNYESHESTLYCKPHFKELFQPKPVEESDQPVRPRKPELIIRENEPKELPPDVVRASDKPDLGLAELSSLNVKSRFQVFEKAGAEANEIERSPSQIAVKRSPSILSKLAKFQAKGMDIGVADESLNGIPYEESSESEEEEEIEESEEVDSEIVKAKRSTRERPISFTKMDDIKNRWESTSQQGRREVQREARKEEIAGIRSRLFMGKQGKMKEMYQQAVAGSERVTKINAAEEIQHSATHARSIKERFERGEPIAASDDETDGKPKPEKADEEVIAAGISRKSRSLFLELDASAAKTGRPVTPVNPKTPAETPRRARDAFMGRQVSDDVVRSSDTTEEVQVETSDISNKFKFFESYKEPQKERKKFRITPPRDGQVKQMESPEREIYRDPDVVRADDRVDKFVHSDTARKMLSIFRQMEKNATKTELPNGPKPLKRFTPPPEDKFAKPTASDSEEEEEEEGDESEGEDSNEERDPNYVRASDKVEDEFLKQAQNAARAKTLCAKFEHWDETDGKTAAGNQNIAEMEIAQNTGDQLSIESASSLRARFESLGSQPTESPRTPKVKVNRFVEIQASCTDVCESCEKKVYPLEKVETNNKIFHKQCFRCLHCNCVLRMDTFTLNNGKLYCIPHFKQLFITRGNYDEGFGVDPHKNKWTTTTSNPTSPSPIAVSNGDL